MMPSDEAWFADSQPVSRKPKVRLGDTKWKSSMDVPTYAAFRDRDDEHGGEDYSDQHLQSFSQKPKQNFGYLGEQTRAGTKKIKKGLLKLNPVLVLRSATTRGAKNSPHNPNHNPNQNSRQKQNRIQSDADADLVHNIRNRSYNYGVPASDIASDRKSRGSVTSSTSNTLSGYSVLDQVRGKLNTNNPVSSNIFLNGNAYGESAKTNRYDNVSNDGDTDESEDEEDPEAFMKKDNFWLKNRSVKKTLGKLNPRKKHKKKLSEIINKNLDKIISMAHEDKNLNSKNNNDEPDRDESFKTSTTSSNREFEKSQLISDQNQQHQNQNNFTLPDSILDQRSGSPNGFRNAGKNPPPIEQTFSLPQASETVNSFSPSLTPTYTTIDGKPSSIENVSGKFQFQSQDGKSADTGSAYESGSIRSRNLDDVNSLTKFQLDDNKAKMQEHLRKLKSEWEREDELRMRKETFRLLKENSKMMKSLTEKHAASSQRSEALQTRLETLRSRTQDSINQLAFKVDAIADSIDDFEQLILGHERAIEDEGHREKSKWEETLHKKIKQQLEAKEEAYFDLIDQLQNRIKILKEANRNSSSVLDGFFHRTVALAISGAGIIISLIAAMLQPIMVIFSFTKTNPATTSRNR